MSNVSRRKLFATAAAVSGVALTARVAGENGYLPPDASGLYGCGHALTYAAQRLLTRHANAREFTASQISKIPHPKGRPPKDPAFARLQSSGFEGWTLTVDGLVDRPATFSIAQLKTYPSRSQTTQLICEEGWSYIAQWNGVPLSHLLQLSGARPQARYVLYYSMDGWVDAIDMDEAAHPQTLVSYGMNSGVVPVGHGGPLRLRVPRQLGYKSLKFLQRISLTDSLAALRQGSSYSWYAGI